MRERREARGWTQEQLVERMAHAITRNHLQNIERGRRTGHEGSLANPQLSTYLALCGALDARIVIDVNRPSGFVIEFVPEDHPTHPSV